MIRTIKHTKAFKKDVKNYKNSPTKLQKLANILRCLASGQKLDQKYKDHSLKGNYCSRRECHIEPDFLLIYKVEQEILYLERLGSHSQLFRL